MNKNLSLYSDIINTDYPFLLKHPRMSMENRAAQFSAFKALSGHDEEIAEAERLTENRVELDEYTKEILSKKIQFIIEKLHNYEQPLVKIVYFKPDDKKSGGAYITIREKIKRIDEVFKTVQTTNGLLISTEDIYVIDGEIFKGLDI